MLDLEAEVCSNLCSHLTLIWPTNLGSEPGFPHQERRIGLCSEIFLVLKQRAVGTARPLCSGHGFCSP